jgi:hypothetical protein
VPAFSLNSILPRRPSAALSYSPAHVPARTSRSARRRLQRNRRHRRTSSGYQERREAHTRKSDCHPTPSDVVMSNSSATCWMSIYGRRAVNRSKYFAEMRNSAKWSTPTVFTPWPLWMDTWTTEWTCARDAELRPLEHSECCRTCPRWECQSNGRKSSIGSRQSSVAVSRLTTATDDNVANRQGRGDSRSLLH